MNVKVRTLLRTSVASYAIVSAHAAVLTVTSLADSGPGSLRQEITLSSPFDTIQFAVNGTILLSSAINIPYALSVQGPGPSALIVDANHVDRAFTTLTDGVVLSGMTIQNGYVIGSTGADGALGINGSSGGDATGGAILNSGNLTVSNCWFTANVIQGGQGGRGGDNPIGWAAPCGSGGIGGWAYGAAIGGSPVILNITVVNCTFSGNRAVGGQGGAGGNNNNFAVPETGGTGGPGGGVYGGAFSAAYPIFTNCTFSGNVATGGSGGNGGDTAAAVTGGQGGDGGPGRCGAINAGSFGASIISCTIVSNSAFGGAPGAGGSGSAPGASGNQGVGEIGGLYAVAIYDCQGADVGNTIIANNFASTSYSNALAGVNDLGFNYLGDDQLMGSCIGVLTRMGTVASPLDPQLGPLAQNGGGLPTHAPLSGSPVIDWGYSFSTTTDERGAPRPFGPSVVGPLGDGSDIGAVELGTTSLGLSLNGTNFVLSWPAYYGDFRLQSAAHLTVSNSWGTAPGTPIVVGNQFQFIVTNSSTVSQMFYRLMSSH